MTNKVLDVPSILSGTANIDDLLNSWNTNPLGNIAALSDAAQVAQ